MTTGLPLYQVDAFADRLFGGNPAAVVPLERWPADSLLQAIAAENNLAETAFFVPDARNFELRWFTPAVEIELCGHATLASAFVIFDQLEPGRREVVFRTRQAGNLTVTRDGDLLTLGLPSRPPSGIDPPAGLADALGAAPLEVLEAGKLLCLYSSESSVAQIRPDFRPLAAIAPGGVIVSAPGDGDTDFVSRFFAPAFGIDEDPVTGSAHCLLVPFWAKRFGRTRLVGRQISARGGTLICEHLGDRVALSGRAQLYLTGRIHLPSEKHLR